MVEVGSPGGEHPDAAAHQPNSGGGGERADEEPGGEPGQGVTATHHVSAAPHVSHVRDCVTVGGDVRRSRTVRAVTDPREHRGLAFACAAIACFPDTCSDFQPHRSSGERSGTSRPDGAATLTGAAALAATTGRCGGTACTGPRRFASRSALRASVVSRLARVPFTIAPCDRPPHEQSQVWAGFVDRWHAAEHFRVPTRFGAAGATSGARFGNPCPTGRSTRFRGAFRAFGGIGFRRGFRWYCATRTAVVAPKHPAATNAQTPPVSTATASHSTADPANSAVSRFCFLVAINAPVNGGVRRP